MGENVKSLKKENDKLKDQVKSLSEDFQRFKDKMAAKVSKEVLPTSRESPSVQDVQFLSDGYDDLLKSREKTARELQKLESRLEIIKSKLSNVSKAIDDIMTYSYQYNIKIIGVPQASDRETSVETANPCLKIFNGIGANISILDIDIAHAVQSRNSNRDLSLEIIDQSLCYQFLTEYLKSWFIKDLLSLSINIIYYIHHNMNSAVSIVHITLL